MTFQTSSEPRRRRRSRSDSWEFRLVFAATFLVMLVPTVISRMALSHWGEERARGSIFHEAGARTDKIVPFMFMG